MAERGNTSAVDWPTDRCTECVNARRGHRKPDTELRYEYRAVVESGDEGEVSEPFDTRKEAEQRLAEMEEFAPWDDGWVEFRECLPWKEVDPR